MGAYEARRQISAWAQEAQKAILDAAATRRKILQEAASGKDRAAREAHMHLNKRTAAAEEIRTLLHDLTTGPSPPKSDDST
jgi:alpha-galactosidase/6-phospho-beta-glucosidase family protein